MNDKVNNAQHTVISRIIIFIVLSGIILGGGYYFLLRDQIKIYNDIVMQIATNNSYKDKLKPMADDKRAHISTLHNMKKLLQTTDKALPSDYDISLFLKDIGNLANKSDANLQSFTVGDELAKNGLVHISVKLQLHGNFTAIAKLINDIERLNRIATIRSISLQIADKNSDANNLNAEVLLDIYKFLGA